MHPPAFRITHIGTCVLSLALAACADQRASSPLAAPPGAPERTRTDALEAGAAMLQNNGPVAKLDIHLVGFHPMKDNPRHQMEAHHYCRQVNEDFAQCALFDAEGEDANLTGIEYIVSERLFEEFPAEERVYWHPHNGEILSGQLIAPGIPGSAEKALMRSKMNSYGKTWHTWHTRDGLRPGDALPRGPAMLAWSFNRAGEAVPGLVASTAKRWPASAATSCRSPARRTASTPCARISRKRPRSPASATRRTPRAELRCRRPRRRRHRAHRPRRARARSVRALRARARRHGSGCRGTGSPRSIRHRSMRPGT
jgi:hypothetical protein